MKKMTALAMALIMSASAVSGFAAHAEEAQYASQINGYSRNYTRIQTDSYTTYTYSYSSDGSESSYSITYTNDPCAQSTTPAETCTQSSTSTATDCNAVLENKTLTMTRSSELFHASEMRPWYFYHLSDYGIIGIGKTGETFHNAGYGKLIARITDGRYLKASFQSFDGSVKCSTITLKNNSGGSEVCSYSKDKHCLTADLYDLSFDNSLYEISAPCEAAASSCDLKLYLYADDSDQTGRKFYICYGEQHDASDQFSPMSRKSRTASLLDSEGVTVSSARSASRLYPALATSSNSDTAYWEKKSHEILDSYASLTSSEKALLLHDWITKNLKYDWYKVKVLKKSRYYCDPLKAVDPAQYVSQNYTGVCLDFSCIYAIMCREHNIPCVVLNSSTHAWNAAYLNNEWIEIDLTQDVNRCVYGEDTTDVKGTSLYCYTGFATYNVNSDTAKNATSFCY